MASTKREVGKEYRSMNVAIVMACMAYVFAAGTLTAAFVAGDSFLLTFSGIMAVFGVASHFLYVKGGGSHYTVLALQNDHYGNQTMKVQYRHGEVAVIPQ